MGAPSYIVSLCLVPGFLEGNTMRRWAVLKMLGGFVFGVGFFLFLAGILSGRAADLTTWAILCVLSGLLLLAIGKVGAAFEKKQ
jgi:hypothetical protein